MNIKESSILNYLVLFNGWSCDGCYCKKEIYSDRLDGPDKPYIIGYIVINVSTLEISTELNDFYNPIYIKKEFDEKVKIELSNWNDLIEKENKKMNINKKELDKYCDNRQASIPSYRLADPSFSLCEGCPFDCPDDCLKETVADFEALEELYFKAKKALELYQQEKIRQQKAEKQKFVGVKFPKDEVVYVFKNDLGELEDDEEVVVKTKYGYAIGRVTPVPTTFDLELAKDIHKKILYKLDILLEKEK